MHIGFDAKRIFFNHSGLGNYSRSSVENLLIHFPNNSYTLFSPKRGSTYEFNSDACEQTIYPSGVLSLVPSLWRSYAMSGSINRSGVDIFHGLSNELPLDIRRAKCKSIVTIHDLIFVRYPELYKPIDRAMYNQKYYKSCLNADHIIAISEQTKADMVDFWKINPEKISVVYQGCNSIFYEQATKERKTEIRLKYNLPNEFVLSVGTVEPRKNLMLTLKAIVEGRMDVNLVACGRWTPYVDQLTEYATRHGILNRITFIHNIDFVDIPALYQMCSVTVYTSIFEGFGIPIIEAMNSGAPVITTRGGVFTETGGDACLYVDINDTDSMIEALNRSLSDKELREELRLKGYQHVKQFREQFTSSNMMEVYKSIL